MAKALEFKFSIHETDDNGALGKVTSEKRVTIDVPGVIKVGRLQSSSLCIEDDSVSRMHAVIEVSGDGDVQIIDLGSTKGTIINGKAVNKSVVSNGDLLQFGFTSVRVAFDEVEASQSSRSRSRPSASFGDLGGVPETSVGRPPSISSPSSPLVSSPISAPSSAMTSSPMGGIPADVDSAAPRSSLFAAEEPASSSAAINATAASGAVLGSVGAAMPLSQSAAPRRARRMSMGVPPVQGIGSPYAFSGSSHFDSNDPSRARAIEITSIFDNTVLSVRQLENPASGRITVVTMVFFAAALLSFVSGLALAISGQTGIGALLMVIGTGLGVNAFKRWHRDKRSPHFVIGAASNTDVYIEHNAITSDKFPLVRSNGVDYALVFTGNMEGSLQSGGQSGVLQSFIEHGDASASTAVQGAYELPLPRDAHVQVKIGQTSFIINSIQPAKRIITPFWAQLDWSPQMFTGLSLLGHALLLMIIFAVPPDARSLSLDGFDENSKFLEYINKPNEELKEEVPEFIKQKGAGKAGGTGRAHKGESGKMGKKTSTSKRGLYALKGPADNPDPRLARQFAENAAKTAGILGTLSSPSGSHLASIFGADTALGSDAENVMGGLVGSEIGESYGVGGLGLTGTGSGGGGTGEGTIGLGRLGTIGKGGGGGKGSGYGRGVGGLGGRKSKVPRVVAGKATVRGSLDKEIIRRIIRRHIREVKHCYSKRLQVNDSLGGRVVIGFTISGTGKVIVSKVKSSTVGDKAVSSCIASAVRRWTFPKPKGGGIVQVSYPFVLRAAGG